MTSSPTSSGSIHTPTTAWESRSATEAMQRVADVMIAVTESFRQQFREQQGGSSRPFGPNGPGDLGWRASAPVLVSPILDDDVSPTHSSPSRPSTAPSAFDPHRPGPASPISPASPTSSRDPTIPSFIPADVPWPLSIARHPAVNNSTSRTGSEPHLQPPLPATKSSSAIRGTSLPRGLAPEELAHPSEYPNLFEAARRIVITQRGRSPFDGTPPNASRENLGPSTMAQADAADDQLPWARRNYLYQSQPLLEKTPPPALTFAQEASLVAVISLYQILMFAGLSQAIAPALDISRSFADLSISQHSWFTAAYSLTLGVFTLPSVRLGHILGHKPVIVFGCLWFALWSLLAGFSLNVANGGRNGTIYFCICRAMQGIGPALCVPNGLSILETTFVPGQRKDVALSLFSVAPALGFVVGAVMASLFAINTAWEWSFFVLATVCVSAAGLSLLVLPTQGPHKMQSSNSFWMQLDVSGLLLGASGSVLFSFAWNQAPAVGWRTPYTYFLLLIGVMFFVAFIYNETVVANPLIPVRAMNSSANLVLGCTAAGWGCFIIWAFYSFQLVEVLRGWDPLLTSAGFVPVAVEGFAVGFLLAYLTPGVDVYWAFLASSMALLLASIMMATAPADQAYWGNTFVSNLLAPLGMVMASPLATILLGNSLAEEHQGIAGGLVISISTYAMSLALGMARTVEVQVNQDGLNILSGYRGAQYFGLGLGGLGVVLAFALLVQCLCTMKR